MARIRAETAQQPEARREAVSGFADLLGWGGRRTIEAYDHSFRQAEALGSFARWQVALDDALAHPTRVWQLPALAEDPVGDIADEAREVDALGALDEMERTFAFWEE
jgi:hypothetical protein